MTFRFLPSRPSGGMKITCRCSLFSSVVGRIVPFRTLIHRSVRNVDFCCFETNELDGAITWLHLINFVFLEESSCFPTLVSSTDRSGANMTPLTVDESFLLMIAIPTGARLKRYVEPNTAADRQKDCDNSPLPYIGTKNAVVPYRPNAWTFRRTFFIPSFKDSPPPSDDDDVDFVSHANAYLTRCRRDGDNLYSLSRNVSNAMPFSDSSIHLCKTSNSSDATALFCGRANDRP
mmetsp:Transcript_19257/g.46505  ORF Transcript_19257/g.46505 Transcript_19257/m.46505 type:complete len:233 (+) Transcript_19257:2143-2841(+)